MLVVCMLLPVMLASLWPPAPGIHTLWDWANGMGYLALALCLFLFAYKGRPRRYPAYSGRFFANLHRDLGYIALALLAGHVGILLAAEPLLLEHFKPTAPLHMLSGLLALLLMALLVLFSVPTLRRRLWPDYHLFRHVHAVLAVAVIALTLYHVVVSAFYLNAVWKQSVLLLSAAAIVISYGALRQREPRMPATRSRNSARYSHAISGVATVSALLACLLFALANNPQ